MRYILFLAFLSGPAMAHDAPSGWSYPIECCSTVDCFQTQSDAVRDVDGGYFISSNNETISSTDSRVKDSPDGLYHLCTQGGKPEGSTLCLFVPPRGY